MKISAKALRVSFLNPYLRVWLNTIRHLSEKVIRGLTENAMKCKFNSDPITFEFNFEPAAITSEHSCSEAFLCPNTAFYGGIRAKCLRSLQNFFYIFQGVLGRNSYADVIRSD